MFKMKIMILLLLLFGGSVFSEVFAMHSHALKVAEVVASHIYIGIVDQHENKYLYEKEYLCEDKYLFAYAVSEAVKPVIVKALQYKALQYDDELSQLKIIENNVARALIDFVHQRFVETRRPARPDLQVPALEVIMNGLNLYKLSEEINKKTALKYTRSTYIALAVKNGVIWAQDSVANGFAIPESVPTRTILFYLAD